MSLGITEITLILIVVILLFGGKRVPELARALGKASSEYKKARTTLENEANDIKQAIMDEDNKQKQEKINKEG